MQGKTNRILVFLLAIAMAGSAVRAQVSTEEAMKRLKEKQEARQAEREKVVTIKQGELDDLKSEIEKLKAQVESLQKELAAAGNPSTKTASNAMRAPRATTSGNVPKGLQVGLTHDQVMQVVQAHPEFWEVTEDTPAEMKIIQKDKYPGTTTIVPLFSLTLTMVNGKVTFINDQKLPGVR